MKPFATTLSLTALAGLALGLGATTANAAFIEAVETPNSSSDSPSPGDLGTTEDGPDGNSLGDNHYGDTGTPAGGTNARLGIRNSSVGDNDAELRAIAEFALNTDLSDDSSTQVRDAINAGARVVLEFDVADIQGTPTFTFEAVNVLAEGNENGQLSDDDYHATAGPALFVVDSLGNVTTDQSVDASTLTVGSTIRFDVTADAKIESLNTIANAFAGYRLQNTVSADTRVVAADQFIQFDEARLVVIPEPASLALLGLGGLLLLPRRKRNG